MDAPAAAAPTASGAATRARILDAANTLFYAPGIRATSADRIIEQVGITKVTFYRHFRSKSDLVVAYLEHRSAAERAWMERLRQEGEPEASLRAIATGIGAVSCGPGFRGCAFINAAAEFSDPADPARIVVAAHHRWTLELFAAIAEEAGAENVDGVARQLLLLRDGAMVNGCLGDPAAVAESLGGAFAAVLVAATPTRVS